MSRSSAPERVTAIDAVRVPADPTAGAGTFAAGAAFADAEPSRAAVAVAASVGATSAVEGATVGGGTTGAGGSASAAVLRVSLLDLLATPRGGLSRVGGMSASRA